MKNLLYGAIEAGGTKFICAVADAQGRTLATTRIPTTNPHDTLSACAGFFSAQQKDGSAYAAIGIAAFGPVDLHSSSPTYGHILATPKPQWSHTNLVAPFSSFGCPVNVDTDVNAAALAESLHGAGRGCEVVVYITVGTGIGGGVSIKGKTLHGAMHPEMGHISVRKHEHDRDFAGTCPFHGDCLEGLACGPAIVARYGASLDALPEDHEAFDVISHYLGQLAATVILMLSPERLIMGGGVMGNPRMLERVRRKTAQQLNGYVVSVRGSFLPSLDALLASPGLGDQSGITGALAMARLAAGQCLDGRS